MLRLSLELFPELRHERALIGFAPDELTLTRVAGRLRPRVVDERHLACDPAYGRRTWEGAAAALAATAASLRGERLQATVVLSNHFVRYAIVPCNDALDDEAEELAYARHAFARIHGERAKDWTVRMSDAPAGAARLACAVDTALLEALRECFPARQGPRLVSAQPVLMSVFNRSRKALPREGAWLLIVEPGRVCIGLHAADRWRAVHSVKADPQSAQDCVALLDRERLLIDGGAPEAVPDTVFVHAARSPAWDWPAAAQWRFRKLSPPAMPGYALSRDMRHGTALAEA